MTDREKELEIRERELAIKERDLKLQRSQKINNTMSFLGKLIKFGVIIVIIVLICELACAIFRIR